MPFLCAWLLACLPVAGAERAVLKDGRDLVCQSRQATEEGWLIGLPEGGSLLLSRSRVERFDALPPAPPVAAPVLDRPEVSSVSDSPAAGETIPEIARRIAREFSVDPRLVEAVIQVESGYDKFAVSPKGASGLMQLMPRTANRFQVGDVFDPVENIRGGVRYLKLLSERFRGDLALVLAAYNAGEGSVERAVGIPPYRETRRYVIQVLERYLKATASPM